MRPEAIKQARLDAGLSLGQVARGDVSRTAIYFIETGKAKPSMETLRLIADRTGRPLDSFLAESVSAPLPGEELAELERLMSVGDNVGAAARSEHLLGQRLDDESAARVKLIAALAYLRMAQPLPGRRYAASARSYFERAGDRLAAADAMGTEAQAAYLMQDPSSLPLAESALDTLRLLKSVPPDAEARLLIILAQVHLQNENWGGAIETYERAIAVGDSVQDLHRLSLMYSGLSLAFQESGQIGEAARYAQKALNIHETLNDRLSLARSLNNLGYMLLGLKEFASARRHIERALRIFGDEQVEVGRGHMTLSLCELEFEEGNLDRAHQLAAEAADRSARLGEHAIVSEAHLWMARVAAERGDRASADQHFLGAIASAEALGRGPRLSRAHEAYAAALEVWGELARANGELKQALAAAYSTGKRIADEAIAIA